MPGLKAKAPVRVNGAPIRKDAIFVAKSLKRARVFAFPACGTIAPCDENHNLVRRVDAYLMRVDSKIQGRWLFDLGTDSPVLGEPVDTQSARIVESDQHVRPRDV